MCLNTSSHSPMKFLYKFFRTRRFNGELQSSLITFECRGNSNCFYSLLVSNPICLWNSPKFVGVFYIHEWFWLWKEKFLSFLYIYTLIDLRQYWRNGIPGDGAQSVLWVWDFGAAWLHLCWVPYHQHSGTAINRNSPKSVTDNLLK